MNSVKNDNSFFKWRPNINNKRIVDEATCQYGADYASVKYRWNIPLREEEYNSLSDYLTTNKHGCKSVMPLAPIGILGQSLQIAETHPIELEIFGSTQEQNKKYRESIQSDSRYYNYCKNIDNTDMQNIYTEIVQEIASNPDEWGIKNFDLFAIKGQPSKLKVCNIIYPGL
jgi:hypothetical protein